MLKYIRDWFWKIDRYCNRMTLKVGSYKVRSFGTRSSWPRSLIGGVHLTCTFGSSQSLTRILRTSYHFTRTPLHLALYSFILKTESDAFNFGSSVSLSCTTCIMLKLKYFSSNRKIISNFKLGAILQLREKCS